jgi:PAS domain S-box-containing protein
MRMGEPDTLLMWRDWFSRAMLAYGAIALPLSMIYNLPVLIAEGRYVVIAADMAFWLFMICLLFVFRFSPNVRGYLSLGVLYAMTVTFLVSLGPFHARPVWLVMCTVFAGIFLGVRGAIAAALFNSTVLMALYALMGPENKAWASVYTESPGSWIMFTFNSSLLALASGLTVGFLLNRLDRSLRYQRDATDTLLKRSKELEKANELLQREMEQRSTAEKTLIQSEMKYRLLAENATDVIWTVDMDLNITYVSPSVYRVCGYTPQRLIATKLTELLTADSIAIATRVLAEESGVEEREDSDLKRSRTMELEFIHKDGSTYWSEVNLTCS